MKTLKILKLNALPRFYAILFNLTIREEVQALIKILYYFFLFILYVHVIACFWYYVVSLKNEWIPPLDFLDYTNLEIYYEGKVYQYLLMMYYMISCFGGNQIAPKNPEESVYIVACMIAAAIINSFIFGEMSFLVTIIGRKQREY